MKTELDKITDIEQRKNYILDHYSKIEDITKRDCILDDSGIYIGITKVCGKVAINIHDAITHYPIATIIAGSTESPIQITKTVLDWLSNKGYNISIEHASYIGGQIAKAQYLPGSIEFRQD